MNTDKNCVIRTRMPRDKEAAVVNLRKMGLTTSDLIRLTFFHVANDGTFPFELSVPRSINMDVMSRKDFENSLSKSFDEEAQEKFQDAEEFFSELRNEPVK